MVRQGTTRSIAQPPTPYPTHTQIHQNNGMDEIPGIFANVCCLLTSNLTLPIQSNRMDVNDVWNRQAEPYLPTVLTILPLPIVHGNAKVFSFRSLYWLLLPMKE